MMEFISEYLIMILIYAMMAFVFVVGILKCIYPILRVQKAFSIAKDKVDKRKPDGAYEYDDPSFLQCKYIDDWWARYIFNLREMRKSNSDCDVINFINMNTTIKSPSHDTFAELIPGLMTSLGILGTFIGLVQGISGLSVNGADIVEMQNSIAILIEGMKDAFYTSIIGVILAVCFQMTRRLAIGRANNALNEFVRICQTVVSLPYTQDTKLIQTIYALLIEVRRSNENVTKVLERDSKN